MEDILALVLIFGGGAAVAMSFSPVGRALADRIRGRVGVKEPDPGLVDEVMRLREDVIELQERLDFTERVLSQAKQAGQLPGGQ